MLYIIVSYLLIINGSLFDVFFVFSYVLLGNTLTCVHEQDKSCFFLGIYHVLSHLNILGNFILHHVLQLFLYLQNVDMDSFDDFGNDLYPALEAPLLESDANVANINIVDKKDDISRCTVLMISYFFDLCISQNFML